jgi:hypothetical protein
MTGESVKPTVHPQIVITEAPQPDSDEVAAWLQSIGTGRGDAVASLARLIPEYIRPQSSTPAEVIKNTMAAAMLPISSHAPATTVRKKSGTGVVAAESSAF